jgi:hypothetical protein
MAQRTFQSVCRDRFVRQRIERFVQIIGQMRFKFCAIDYFFVFHNSLVLCHLSFVIRPYF